jgi:hypothetical protein
VRADGVLEWEPKPCSGLSDLFFSDDRVEQTVAKSICKTCPHGVWCADRALDAIAAGETGGVWAGMTLVELEEKLRDVDRNRARTAGHPSSIAHRDVVPELREASGVVDGDLSSLPDRPGPAPGA